MTVPNEWQAPVNQVVSKMLQQDSRLKLLWYCPSIYLGLQNVREQVGRYSARR
jgi:hypothetical protein